MEDIINTHPRESVRLHSVLQSFRAGRGTGMEIFELNISQELASMDQDSLFMVLIELKKAYDTVYRGRLLKILEGYGDRLRMYRLLEVFCDQQKVIIRQNW